MDSIFIVLLVLVLLVLVIVLYVASFALAFKCADWAHSRKRDKKVI